MELIIEIILTVWFLAFVPMVLGSLLCRLCRIQKTLAGFYVIGMLLEWAVFEVITVPAILLKVSLTLVTVLWCIGIHAVLLVAVYLNWKKKKAVNWDLRSFAENFLQKDVMTIVLIVVMFLAVGIQMYVYLLYQHTDADDARFIANAVAAWDSDTMLLTHPNTGEVLDAPIGELQKDAVSPWMIFIAMLAKLLTIHPTIVAHTVLPVFLVLVGYCACWCMGEQIFKDELWKKCLFVILVCIFNLFCYASKYTGATFFMTRVWQGKAVVAGVIIPFLFSLMLRIQDEYENKRLYWLIFVMNCAACLLSGMGLVFSAVMTGCFIFCYALYKRSVKSLLYGVAACIPNLVLGILYLC